MMQSERVRVLVWMLAVAGICGLCASSTYAAAFATAEGFGADATGGRGGSVYHVTNLNDSGSGSLRYGIDNASGPTTIVFDVGGTIQLSSTLGFNKSNLTIAGQTAPGGGISVAGQMCSVAAADNVVMRYMRFRLNNTADDLDCLNIYESSNVILDHVSTAWGTDGTLDITKSNYVTVQNSIIAQTLTSNSHSYASLVRGNVAATTPGGITLARNLWCHNDKRSPGIGSHQTEDDGIHADLQLDMVNNVIYDWGSRSSHSVASEDDMYVNMVNNMYVAGPNTSTATRVMTLEFELSWDFDGDLNVYQSGNKIDSDKNSTHNPTSVTTSNFKDSSWWGNINYQGSRYAFPTVTTMTADAAYTSVLANAGASLVRDSFDSLMVSQVGSRTGSIVSSPGTLPTIASGTCATDTDQDGMPDAWETLVSLNPNDAADGAQTAANGYTNLENYLGYLVGEFNPGSASFSPVPEPSTLVLLAMASVALLLRRRMVK